MGNWRGTPDDQEEPTLTHVVQKAFEDGAPKDPITRQPGELVYAHQWPLWMALENQRYIAPMPAAVEPLEGGSGDRWWANTRARDRHDPVRRPGRPKKEENKPQRNKEDYPRHVGFGRWELSDGTVLQLGKGGRTRAETEEQQVREED